MKEQKIISEAIENIFSKIHLLNPQSLNISESGRTYLIEYINNYVFYMSIYSQLLQKTLRKLNKPISESTFTDYGGGCGILSYLAKEIGFKTVIYNDINRISVNDAQVISGSLDIKIDYFLCGDAEEFINEINILNIKPDLICSFDVLEHIYDLEFWFKTIAKIKNEFSLLFMTSANSGNPYLISRLKKIQIESEHKGYEKNIRRDGVYINTSFLEERRNIIRNRFPQLQNNEINLLSIKTRGLRIDDIEKVVCDYVNTGKFSYEIKHSTNTCDPYTGSWAEKLIDIKQLKFLVRNNDMIVDISNSFYSYSDNKILNLPKYLLNQLIRVLGPGSLFFSPTFTLEIHKPLKIQ